MRRSEIKRRPLADTVLASLEPDDKEYREVDGNGLYFRVKPDGQKSWQLRYKTPAGKWSWMGLGGYPQVGGALARQKAAELKADAAAGRNPLTTKQAREAEQRAVAANFEALAREWFEIRRGGWEPGTARRIIGALELHVFPVFGKRPYAEIPPIEWMEFLQGLGQKGIVDQMGNIRRYCKDVYDLARVTGRAVFNPLEGLHRYLQTKPSENYAHVSAEELPALLRAIRAYPNSHVVKIGLQLLILTGTRPSELREAPWSEVDMKAGLWTIPAARMKKRRDHTVPLSRQALTLLAELQTLTGAYPLMFPGRNDRTKPLSDMVFNMALRRLGYQRRQTGHGFRHIASTTLRENGFSKEYVEAQLSHTEEGVAGVYNKAIYIDQRREMMQWYADHLDSLADGKVLYGSFNKVSS